MKNKIAINNISQLASIIEETHEYFATHVQKQVNVALTLRNWLIGYYLIEYEQNGTDRAEYGKALINNLSVQLKQRNLKGFSEIALRLNRSFYLAYPQIQQTLSVEYATSGLSHQVFVSKYMINLPKEEELKKIIFEEQIKLNKGLE